MSFSRLIKVPAIINLRATDKNEALRELAARLCKARNIRKVKHVVDDMLRREESASTFMGQGLAIPQSRVNMRDDFAIAVGRSMNGIEYDAARGALAHIIVLVLINEKEPADTIELLSHIDSYFKSENIQKRILSSEIPLNIKTLVSRSPEDFERRRRGTANGNPVVGAAIRLSKEIKAAALLVLADAVEDDSFLKQIRGSVKTIIATCNKSRFNAADKRLSGLIYAPAFPTSRTGQMKIGVFLALSRNLIQRTDKIVCMSGNSRSGSFDTVVALDIATEYKFFLNNVPSLLPGDVKPEVLERLLTLSGEIAVEGREGKPTGTIFVIGDTNSVNRYVRQLIINPFRGYSETERNILDPGLAETLKEFSAIDGAFVITGDGIVISAGSYLRPENSVEIEPLPSGFGSRHAAAAGITACTESLAITISESTGMVSMFKNGAIIMTIAKPLESRRGFTQKSIWDDGVQNINV
jgi:DNA integrity scanning protein DisA with diadenylate cyclase activity/mannitol/fructose-specific phosphotransferase system IIA component (Ntr-type)